jgi:hypothetical protein
MNARGLAGGASCGCDAAAVGASAISVEKLPGQCRPLHAVRRFWYPTLGGERSDATVDSSRIDAPITESGEEGRELTLMTIYWWFVICLNVCTASVRSHELMELLTYSGLVTILEHNKIHCTR